MLPYLFQFQSGTIKGNCCNPEKKGGGYFNSNLVRLKDFYRLLGNADGKLFQFQSGTIKGQAGFFI